MARDEHFVKFWIIASIVTIIALRSELYRMYLCFIYLKYFLLFLADGIYICAGAIRAPGRGPVGREHEEHADSGVLAKDRDERQVLHRVSVEVSYAFT